MINLLGYDYQSLTEFFTARSEKSFRAQQLIKWIHQQRVTDFAEMTNFSNKLREDLQESCQIKLPEIESKKVSQDGVVKWLFKLADGNLIESVFIPEHNRGTLCISSQVGCYLNCSFCATALQGFNRNLTSAEIIAQLWLASQQLDLMKQPRSWEGKPLSSKITNVVFMGMGEPLLNMRPVCQATNLMLFDNAYGLSKRRVTISTAGIAPMIAQLAQNSQASLAVSLHSAINSKRSQLMPLNKKYPLSEVMEACWQYVKSHQQKHHILFEYVMLKGVNDALEDAKALVQLLKNFPAKVNLIPFNPYPGLPYQCSDSKQIEIFQNHLRSNGLNTTLRKTRGQDINAACGQLAGKVANRVRTRKQKISTEKLKITA